MAVLSDAFIQSLVARLDNENTIGVTMAGSHPRNEGGPYSDVDIQQYVRQLPTNPVESYYLRFMDGFLVSISVSTLEQEYTNLGRPQKAIWAVPGLRQARILLDKDGSVTALKEFAEKFNWPTLQAAANAFASWNLCGYAEEIHKILGGLANKNESKALYAIWGLRRGLAVSLLVQRGILIQTENDFIDLAQQAAGRASGWTRQFRLAVGLDPLPLGEPSFIGYGKASLRLYCETAGLFKDILAPEEAEVINRTLKIIAEAGY